MIKRGSLIALAVLLPILLVQVFVQSAIGSQPDDRIVPINGTAYWGTAPTGPDFSGVRRIPFQARNPQAAVVEATQRQNQQYLDAANILENLQVSDSGTFSYATEFISDFSEVMLAIDPADPDHLLGGSKFFFDSPNYRFYSGVFESYDGGQSWTQFQPAGLENYDLASDPVTTFDELGNSYFTILTVTDGVGPDGVEMLKKPAGGSWGAPVPVYQTPGTDKQWIVGDQDPQGISPYAGSVYMCWKALGTPIDGIVFSRSTDRNQTWSSPPVELDAGGNQGCMPAVTPDGTVYVVYINYDAADLSFVKSTDGGVSFTSPASVAAITNVPYQLPNSDFRTPDSLPSLAANPTNGDLYVAWSDYRNGDADIYFTRSSNGGANWSTPVRLNDDPLANGIDQFQPQVSVAPNGRVAVMWFDRRLDCPDLDWIAAERVGLSNNCIDTFMTRSYDDGQTWVANIRASAQTWDWKLNMPTPSTSPTVGFIGDYQGIASNNEFDFPFWNATANLGDNPDNHQEIFVAHVPAVNLSASQKQVEPALVLPADVLSYTILLNNASTDDAAVVVTDTLPLSTTYESSSLNYSSGSGAYNPATRTISWTGTVSSGLPVTVSFAAAVDFGLQAGDMITNTAQIADGIGGFYERSAAATVVTPDLSSSLKQVAPGTVNPGSTLEYSITLNNNSAAAAANAQLTDNLPVDVTYQNGSLTYSSGTASYSPGTRTITWNGSVVQGVPVTIGFRATADPGLLIGDQITNTAVIADGVGGIYERSATATVGVSPDLSASQKQVSSPTVIPGDTLSYTITVSNSTSTPAQAEVTDVLPAGTSYVANSLAASSGSGSYNPATRTISWNGLVSQGQPVTISFQVTADAGLNNGEMITNKAEIYDGLDGTYQRFASTTVVAPDLSPSKKQVSSPTVIPGGVMLYTITLANSTATAAQAQVEDTLPPGTTYVASSLAYSSGSGSYSPATRTISWNGTVSQGQTVTITFQVTTDAGLNNGDVITNKAEIYDGLDGTYQRFAMTTVVTPPSNYDIYMPAVLRN